MRLCREVASHESSPFLPTRISRRRTQRGVDFPINLPAACLELPAATAAAGFEHVRVRLFNHQSIAREPDSLLRAA